MSPRQGLTLPPQITPPQTKQDSPAAVGDPIPRSAVPRSRAGKPLPSVQPIISMRSAAQVAGAVAAAGTHRASYELQVKTTEWVDSGITVGAGEQASFNATGQFVLQDGRVVGPAGLERGLRDVLLQFPLNSAPVGALVGRVSDLGASVPFLIGATSEVTMPTSGRLYLKVNLPADVSGVGTMKIKLKFAPTSKPVAVAKAAAEIERSSSGPVQAGGAPAGSAQNASAPAVSIPSKAARPVSQILSPETFADIPRRVTDKAGSAGDMINFALLGSQEQVETAFRQAGWLPVDKNVEDAVLHGILATMSHEAYTQMPMSTLYLFGRPQDLSFARADALTVAAERHHLRLWQTDKGVGGMPLWVGSATHDIGFETDQRNGGVTHRIDPKIDGERDYILQSFDAAGSFSSAAYVVPADPLTEARTATGGTFVSDGRIAVMELK